MAHIITNSSISLHEKVVKEAAMLSKKGFYSYVSIVWSTSRAESSSSVVSLFFYSESSGLYFEVSAGRFGCEIVEENARQCRALFSKFG